MGNRSYLYLGCHDAAEGFEQVAEANNNLPVLWQLLLAQGQSGEAITYQRLFGDAGTDNLQADAAAGLARLRRLTTAMAQHPLLPKLPAVLRQFEALLAWWTPWVEAAQARGQQLVFSANLDELSWMDGSDPEEFIRQTQAACDQTWWAVSQALESGHYAALDAALELSAYGKDFADWPTWAWHIGLSGLSHPYFDMRDPPLELDWADFEPEPQATEEGDYLGGDFWRHRADSGVGVVWRDPDQADAPEHVVLTPEWDAVEPAMGPSVWLRRGHQWGYALLHRDGAQLVLPPCLDEWFEAEEDGDQLYAVVAQGGREGLLRADGQWQIAPFADELWPLVQGYAAFRQGDQQGFVDRDGRVCVPAHYDDVCHMDAQGRARVQRNGLWGLITAQDATLLPLVYEALAPWHSPDGSWLLTQNGRQGLAHPDGRPWLETAWDEIGMLVPGRLLKVRQGADWGVLDWAGQARIAPQFEDIDTLDSAIEDEEEADEDDQDAPPWLLKVVRQGRTGLWDEFGKELVPTLYESIERLAPTSPLLRVWQSQRSGHIRRCGVFQLEQGQEILPCTHDHILALTLADAQPVHALLCSPAPGKGQPDPGLRLYRADGSPMLPQALAWLGRPMSPNSGTGRLIVPHHIQQAWGRGEPVEAQSLAEPERFWLHADGRCMPHLTWMHQRIQSGDLQAALDLGRQLRDGDGLPAHAEQARACLARAAGLSDWPLDGPPQPLPAPNAARRPGLVEAIAELSDMLRDGLGGPSQAMMARAWLLHAQDLEPNHREVLVRLGYLFTQGVGGNTDLPRGRAFYQQAAEAGVDWAWHNLGIMAQEGQGQAVDLPQALSCFRKALAAGDQGSAYHVGELLCRQAEAPNLPMPERQALWGEAAYHLQQLVDADHAEHLPEAQVALATLYLNPASGMHQPHAAEPMLCAAAQHGQAEAMRLLATLVYGDPHSPLANPAQAAHWQAQWTAHQAEAALAEPRWKRWLRRWVE